MQLSHIMNYTQTEHRIGDDRLTWRREEILFKRNFYLLLATTDSFF